MGCQQIACKSNETHICNKNQLRNCYQILPKDLEFVTEVTLERPRNILEEILRSSSEMFRASVPVHTNFPVDHQVILIGF